jgi:hypothetical protein
VFFVGFVPERQAVARFSVNRCGRSVVRLTLQTADGPLSGTKTTKDHEDHSLVEKQYSSNKPLTLALFRSLFRAA